MGEEKRKKMHGEEVTMRDMILKNRELETKIFDLKEEQKGLKSRIENLENKVNSISPGTTFVGGVG